MYKSIDKNIKVRLKLLFIQVSALIEKTRNDNARKLEHTSRRHRNCIRIHPQNSKRHEMKKVEICWELLQEGKEFVTEAEFEDKDIRADIYVLDDAEIIEVESSDYELDERKSKYPDEKLTIIHLD